MSKAFLRALINIIYPAKCLFCGILLPGQTSESLICKNCFQNIKFNVGSFCIKCGMGLQSTNSDNCPACKKRIFHFDRAWSACIYEEPLKKLIHLFKYNLKLKLKKIFSSILIQFIKDSHIPIQNYEILLAVPMHPARLREREINHSQILTSELGNYFKIPNSYNKLVRIRNGALQMNLGFIQRINNVKGTFAIRDKENSFKDKNILIIDDVFTTGSTVSEMALVLKKAQAARVDILTLSRAKL